MKKLLVIVFLSLFWSTNIFAGERCPLSGNAYVFEAGDTQYELSGFECTFGPGCQADCDLWYGNFDTGPLYHVELPFTCEENGDVLIAGIPCALTLSGDLECLPIIVDDYKYQIVGTKTWCVPKTTPETLIFDKKE